MAVNAQHEKVLLIYKLFIENSDSEHMYTLKDIKGYLADRGIHAERKAIYRLIELLRKMGLDIVCIRKDSAYNYYLKERMFKPGELKFLIDSVQSSRFISRSASDRLVKKIAELGGENLKQELNHQITVVNRETNSSRNLFSDIDRINEAINKKIKIKFKYYKWKIERKGNDVTVKRETRKDALYVVTPIALMWDDEFYYLVGYDHNGMILKNFRVDRMGDVIFAEKASSVKELEVFEPEKYSKRIFGMYGGDIRTVDLRFDMSLINPVIDKFGRELTVTAYDDTSFTIRTKVMVSPQFFAWLFGFKDKAELLSPDDVRKSMKEYIGTVEKLYE